MTLDPEQVLERSEEIALALDEEELGEAMTSLLVEANAKYAADCWAWLTEQVITKDEASQALIEWPAEKEYLRELLVKDLIEDPRPTVIPKSRRMMVSWLVSAWALWLARFHPNHAIYIQSETEDKAAFLVDQRCVFIEDNLRVPALRKTYEATKTKGGQTGRLYYPATRSFIRAVAQGGNVARTFTPSVWIMDECDFQPEAAEALAAALPFVEKKMKLVLITTSAGPRGIVAEICRGIGFTRYC